jgi:hypothetical protein
MTPGDDWNCATYVRSCGFPFAVAEVVLPMLEMRPNCECCGTDLDPSGTEARICSFECTFCAACAEGTLKGKCPNCGGGLVARPARAVDKLARFPASTKRVVKQGGCTA